MDTALARPRPLDAAWRLAGLLLVACGGSLLVALGNNVWFAAIDRALGGLADPLARALVFSSFLLLIGGIVVARDPARFGLRVGDTRRAAGLIVGTCIAYALLTLLAVRVAGGTPYDDASRFVEIVLVPVSEELVFRAVLLTVLLAAVARWVGGRRVTASAVIIDAIAFGLAHAANALVVDPAFVAMQVGFAVVVGLGCAGLMVRSRSVYPAILLHAVVNGVVVFA